MDPLQALEEDNLLLASVIEALLEFATELASPPFEQPPTSPWRKTRLAEFLITLSELTHNEKESLLLLPAMVQAGGDWNDGPIAQARENHLQQNHLMGVLSSATQQREPWSPSTTRQVEAAIRQYVTILSRSISTAHDTLYPAARQTVPPARLAELSQRLDEFDEDEVEPHCRQERKSGAWIRRLSLAPPTFSP